MSTGRRNLEQVIAAIADRKPALELGPFEICFLIALHVRAEGAQLTSFTETQLQDVFSEVASAMNESRRATAAIQRLREQRLLARVDGQGVVRTGEFALSRLAIGIVEFFLEDDVLTRASLAVLTASLRTAIGEIVERAKRGEWEHVVGPLDVTITELVDGIERRQRGLDLQQEDFQAEIRRLIEADWFGALDRCQALLESTSATLAELNDVLLRDSSVLLGMLHDIEDLAIAAGSTDAEAAAHRLMDQIDRSVAWGAARQRAWSEYYQYVHRYLRDVVRLDPTRALTQRLRDQLAGSGAKFALAYAAAPPLRVLRDVAVVADPIPVTKPRQPREKEPVLATEEPVDPQIVLDEKVDRSIAGGARSLSNVTADVTGEAPEGEQFLEAGRVAHTVAKRARVESEHEREWVPVGQIELEEWKLR